MRLRTRGYGQPLAEIDADKSLLPLSSPATTETGAVIEIGILILGLIVVWYVIQNSKAKSIVRQHSATLSRRTGIPAAQIERQMIEQRLTPGEWAARHGLDRVTFEPRAGNAPRPPAATSGHLPGAGGGTSFGEREIAKPDWAVVEDHVHPYEQRVGASACWTVGDTISHPASVYLTDHALYVHVSPDTVADDQTVRVPHDVVERCDVGTSDAGSPRLVVMYRVGTDADPGINGFGLDLRPASTGAAFGEQVKATIEQHNP